MNSLWIQFYVHRGSGIVTRRPLILQLYNTVTNSDGALDGIDGVVEAEIDGEEWGEFLHQPGKR